MSETDQLITNTGLHYDFKSGEKREDAAAACSYSFYI